MRIAAAELYELTLPLVEPFVISSGVMRERRSWVVILDDGEGHRGWGECPPFAQPFYSEETLATAHSVLVDLLLPRVVGASFDTPEDVDAALRDGVRGNPFARAAIETAAWDLEADRRGTGIAELLGERLGVDAAHSISCGVALGIPVDHKETTLASRISEAVRAGYRRVKIKIGPAWDLKPVETARAVLAGSNLPLTVDANAAYHWPDDFDRLQLLDDAGLLYIEQPLPPDELVGHAALSQRLKTAVCVDETLRSAAVGRQLLDLDGPRVWNVKVHRVGGLTEALRIHRLAESAGVKLWTGTMPESGIGSQAALAFAALPQCHYPSDVEPSTRWFGAGNDPIELVMTPDGRMAVPDRSIARQIDPHRYRSAARLIPF